jgi:hypothetical protein
MSAFDDRVEGELVRFTFRTDEGGFAVARVKSGPGQAHLVVGPIAHVTEGQHVALEGRWVDHSQFGKQFKTSRVLVDDPHTLQGLTRDLASDRDAPGDLQPSRTNRPPFGRTVPDAVDMTENLNPNSRCHGQAETAADFGPIGKKH